MDDIGDGSGDGSGYGCGYGDGYGYGCGYGDGCGSGSGYGCGYGDGYGFGDGHGSGSGDGYGYGYGYKVGSILSFDVLVLWPWRYLLVGCECHHLDWWSQHWLQMARKYDVTISQVRVEELSCKVLSCVAALAANASCSVSRKPNQ